MGRLFHTRVARGLTVTSAAAVLASVPAAALEWQTTPTVSLASTNDSNYRLRSVDEREVSSSQLDASANIEGASDRITLSLRPRFRAINYSDDREFDRNDKYLYSSLALGGERQQVTLSADYVRDGTLTNALEDTGYTEVDADRDRSIYGLGWAAATSERGTFSLSLNTQAVTYVEDLVASPLVDYDYASAGLSYTHALSERAKLSFSLSGGSLETQSTFGDSETYGLALLYERALSESLTLRIGAGRYATRRPGWMTPDQHDGSLDFSLDKRWDRWSLTSSLAADVEPSAYGVLYRRETASVRIGRQFSERIDAGLRISGGRVESDQPLLIFEDRRYGSGQLNINWRVAERLWLSFDIGTRGQEYFQSDRVRAAYGQVAFTYRGRGS